MSAEVEHTLAVLSNEPVTTLSLRYVKKKPRGSEPEWRVELQAVDHILVAFQSVELLAGYGVPDLARPVVRPGNEPAMREAM